ncbi:MAG: glycerophosphodiester phosphodiesterase [Anaerolineae bacterium]|nr:glycerophosphodiester phosphodiesterase [Anaerolineae bacterium]
MKPFEIVAHRGIATEAPENTLEAFERAVQLGADAVELDVRLTSDFIPVVYHYFYLHENTSASGAIYDYSLQQLRQVQVFSPHNATSSGAISTLSEVIGALGGRIGLEIEIKGPEPEAPQLIGDVLNRFKPLWGMIEVTSYEPALLLAFQAQCPEIPVDLLVPRSEAWMGLDVVYYQALHRARLSRARAVHLHPTQLSAAGVTVLRHHGIEVHMWDANTESFLAMAVEYGIPRVCTDCFQPALAFRDGIITAE